MNTDANYRGRNSYANSSPQTAQSGPNPPLSPDDWQPVHADVYAIQTDLLRVVDEFLCGVSPIQAINNLLEYWLITSAPDLTKTVNNRQISTALDLVNFLDKLRDINEALRTETSAFDEKEVSRG
ncbi:hypothetical protein [Spirosoma validum]|uniref:Uncharacterized protein n=1 Tax=Spirosoma validum TaxID=2771355 RepID=A0A927B1D3_9BACT|nr:hypothetical protein [Spirosoma validum]MBD2753754.1 hypothetical protein [Spirosoma validum]